MATSCGIFLGPRTYSLVLLNQRETLHYQSFSIPLSVLISQNQRLVGNSAVEFKKKIPPTHLKELQETSAVEIEYQGKTHVLSRPIISSMLLSKLRDLAYNETREDLESAVICVPANSNSFQRKDILDAAKVAGFKTVKLVNIPTAIALFYCRADFLGNSLPLNQARCRDAQDQNNQSEKEKARFLVVDYLQSSLTVSVAKIKNSNLILSASMTKNFNYNYPHNENQESVRENEESVENLKRIEIWFKKALKEMLLPIKISKICKVAFLVESEEAKKTLNGVVERELPEVKILFQLKQEDVAFGAALFSEIEINRNIKMEVHDPLNKFVAMVTIGTLDVIFNKESPSNGKIPRELKPHTTYHLEEDGGEIFSIQTKEKTTTRWLPLLNPPKATAEIKSENGVITFCPTSDYFSSVHSCYNNSVVDMLLQELMFLKKELNLASGRLHGYCEKVWPEILSKGASQDVVNVKPDDLICLIEEIKLREKKFADHDKLVKEMNKPLPPTRTDIELSRQSIRSSTDSGKAPTSVFIEMENNQCKVKLH